MSSPDAGRFATNPVVLWLLLFFVSVSSGLLFFWLAVPAPFFVAAVLCGLFFSLSGALLCLPRPLFVVGQSLIGCSVARAMTPDVWQTLIGHGLILSAMVLTTIVAGALVGWSMMKAQLIPGSTAAWGSSPGGATAMVVMAEDYGADARLVALMQYLRVLIVIFTASMVVHFLAPGTVTPERIRNFSSLLNFGNAWKDIAMTLSITGLCSFGAYRLRIPAGPLLGCMIVGAVINSTGVLAFRLPEFFQIVASLLLGWRIGLGFDRESVRSMLGIFHWLVFSAFFLIALCAGFSWLLHHFSACDPLTAYLATTPGGLESVILLAMGSGVDVPFVIGAQSLRLFLVILTGPMIARFLCRRA